MTIGNIDLQGWQELRREKGITIFESPNAKTEMSETTWLKRNGLPTEKHFDVILDSWLELTFAETASDLIEIRKSFSPDASVAARWASVFVPIKTDDTPELLSKRYTGYMGILSPETENTGIIAPPRAVVDPSARHRDQAHTAEA